MEESEILRLSYWACGYLEENKRKSSLIQILAGSTRWHVPGSLRNGTNEEFQDYLARYVMFRTTEKQGHKRAVDSIRYVDRGVHRLIPRSLSNDQLKTLVEAAGAGLKVALIEAKGPVNEDDPWVGRYQALCEQIAVIYRPEGGAETIAALTATAYLEMESAHNTPFPDELLDGAIQWGRERNPRGDSTRVYQEYLAQYKSLRIKRNMEHEAIMKHMLARP